MNPTASKTRREVLLNWTVSPPGKYLGNRLLPIKVSFDFPVPELIYRPNGRYGVQQTIIYTNKGWFNIILFQYNGQKYT